MIVHRGRFAMWAAVFVCLCFVSLAGRSLRAQPGRGLKIVDSREVKVRGGVLQVDFAEGQLDEPQAILRRIQSAASAVAAYYGSFPLPRVRMLVVPVPGRR